MRPFLPDSLSSHAACLSPAFFLRVGRVRLASWPACTASPCHRTPSGIMPAIIGMVVGDIACIGIALLIVPLRIVMTVYAVVGNER